MIVEHLKKEVISDCSSDLLEDLCKGRCQLISTDLRTGGCYAFRDWFLYSEHVVMWQSVY